MSQIRDHLQALRTTAEDDASEDSDLSIDDGSVFSARVSLQSAKDEGPGRGTNAILIQEFTSLLYQDGALTSLISAAVSENRIGSKRVRAIFRKLLKRYTEDLHKEIWNDDHKAVIAFLSSYSTAITREYFSGLFASNRTNKRANPETLKKLKQRQQLDQPPEVENPESARVESWQQQPPPGYWETRKTCCNCQKGTDLKHSRHFACYFCGHQIGDHCIDTSHWVDTHENELPLNYDPQFYDPSVRLGQTESSEPIWHEINDRGKPGDDSHHEPTVESASEGKADNYSLKHLKQMERFILESVAYETLHRRLYEFVYPTLQTRLQNLLAKWSQPDYRYYCYVTRYKLSNLVSELQCIHSSRIRFEDRETAVSHRRSIINYCQDKIEHWTREDWDWWPLPPCLRILNEGEVRVRWECTCGEDRWAKVPLPFASRLKSIIRNLPALSIARQDSQSPFSHQQSSSDQGAKDTRRAPTKSSKNQKGNIQPAGSASAISSQPKAHSPKTANINIPNHWVLLIVKQGSDYKLAQICVEGLTCHHFFSTLRQNYFQLRGFLRSWFSVWRYSHCDFYMCEKFEDHAFAPKQRDAFPIVTNTDYEYQPKPIGVVPPISMHEFRKRFYACHQPNRFLHWYHKCLKLGLHSSELLDRFPKKKTEFEEGGDKREDFWGIYAREQISFRWVLLYNLICLSPMIAFFIAWIAPRGQSSDLQNPAVPLSMMMGMLSLFWSTYLSTLQFGKGDRLEV